MTEISEFIIGGGLLVSSVFVELRDALEFVPAKFRSRTEKVIRMIIMTIALAVLLDPLISGTAGLTVTAHFAPASYPTLSENLRVRVIPVGARGAAGADRTVDAAFDKDGTVDVVSKIAVLETRVEIDVYDLTQPDRVLRHTVIWLSPFVRCQLLTKTVTL